MPAIWAMLAAGLVIGVVIAAIVAWRMWPAQTSPPALKLTIEWPDNVIWVGPSGSGVAISPDGTHLAYIGVDRSGPRVFVQDLRGDDVRVVSSSSEVPYTPFFSPDRTQIGFVSSGNCGVPPWLAALHSRSGWSHDSTELFYRGLGSNRRHMFEVLKQAAASTDGRDPK